MITQLHESTIINIEPSLFFTLFSLIPVKTPIPQNFSILKRKMKSSICIVVLMLMGCASIRVTHDFDSKAKFDTYTTYNYSPDLNSNLSELDERRVMHVLDSVMQSRGYEKAITPTFYVALFSEAYETPSNSNVGIGIGGGGGNVGIGVGGTIPVGGNEQHRRLVIDFLDANSTSLIWRAETRGVMKAEAKPEQRKAFYKACVLKALEKYPPK